jgi:hypothetical protein
MTTSKATHSIYYHLFDIPDDGLNDWNYFNTITDAPQYALSIQQTLEYEDGVPCCIETEIVELEDMQAFDEYVEADKHIYLDVKES